MDLSVYKIHMPEEVDQDPEDHKPEYYDEDDGRWKDDNLIIWFRGERRTIGSLSSEELRFALMDAHADLLGAGRCVTRQVSLTEPTQTLERAQRFLWRHQATQ